MEFVNHTSYPALAFQGVDPLEQAFHVVVMRQSLTWGAAGQLVPADVQAPLCEADEFFDGATPLTSGSPRQESDLCHFKPRCDVIVNAVAHAPVVAGRCASRFDVRLVVQRPDAALSDGGGAVLLDKSLRVWGPRELRVAPGASALLRRATLGLVQPVQRRLSEPTPQPCVPLRLELAFGGQAALLEVGRLRPEADRLRQEAFAANPNGCGWTHPAIFDAAHGQRLAAPQIEDPARPFSANVFDALVQGKADPNDPHLSHLVAGLGVRPKSHPDRLRLAGTIDQAFIDNDAPLPADFDFAVWNAAWPDQQLEHLQGDERIGLMNLCAPDTPGAWTDERGNTVLRLMLQPHGALPFLLVRHDSGSIGELAMRLDTLLIAPEERNVSLVWRAVLPLAPAVRALELRALSGAEVAACRASAAQAESTAEGAFGG